MLLHPNAKINLGLIIKGRRPDGYHLLETLYFPLTGPSFPQDELEINRKPEAGIEIRMEGTEEEIPLESNLVWKAWNLFRQQVPEMPGISIRLRKNIPSGAGLGGGSSDAAHTLLALNEISGAGLSRQELAGIGEKLGADVPFFLFNQAMFASGTGTILEPFPLDFPYRIELITPALHSSTPEAYKGLVLADCDPSRDLKSILRMPVPLWKDHLQNDLELPVFRKFPQLKKIKEDLYAKGALYAAMSGSGSAVFGIFPA